MGPSGNRYYSVFIKQQANRVNARQTSWQERLKKLSVLEKNLLASRRDLNDALFRDLRKPSAESDIIELWLVLSQIRHVKANLRNWMRKVKIHTPVTLAGSFSYITYEAKGTCLIISPWNYPVVLSLGPLVSALAAGNTAIIKPSEQTPNTSSFIKKIVENSFDESDVAVIEGDKETAIELLNLPLDHIFFTGSPATGKKVMEAASQHLSTVTLELGGKSPAYVEHDADITDAAEKIAAAKFVNAGQTCIAPDYVIAHSAISGKLIEELQKQLPRYENGTAIINDDHLTRLQSLVDVYNPATGRVLKPMVIETGIDHPLMQQEIFGPILPVIKVNSKEEALKIISNIPTPLGIYVFGRSAQTFSFFRNHTFSGSICFNECAVHFLNPALPFGGSGNSGFGRSHGKAGFITFSNERTIFMQRRGFTLPKLLYPPYTNFKKKIINLLVRYF